MLQYTLRRLVGIIAVLFLVVTMTFFFIRLAPGGPFDAERAVSEQVLRALNARYNLDQPMHVQYLDYVWNLLHFDMGPSFKYSGRDVHELILTGLPITFELGMYAILFALFLGLLSGFLAGLNPNSLKDYVPMSFAMAGICIPSFLLGPLLIILFVFVLEVLPVGGWDSFDAKILPAITLGSSYAAYIARLSRGSLLEVMNQDYIRTARAKGVPEHMVLMKHALRGALLPVVSFMGPAIAGLLSGSFVVETIFNIPGLGRFYVEAAFNRDYTMILGTTIFFAALIAVMNLISDLVTVKLNPRLKFQGAK